MSGSDSLTPFLRSRRRAAATVLLVALVVAVFIVGAVTVIGLVGTGGADDDSAVPAAQFTFAESNVSITDADGEANRTAIEIAYRSGQDVYQGRVVVLVNDRTAWDVSETADGTNATRAVWDETTAQVSDESIRVVVYGTDLGETEIEDEDRSGQYSYLEEGDVVEIVWHDDDGETTTVLQRFVVGEE